MPVPVPEFTEDELKYIHDEFVLPASDEHGHSSKQTVRLMPVMARQIDVLVASKRFPYETASELIRHAVFRHLHWLAIKEPSLPTHFLNFCDAIAEHMRDGILQSGMETTLKGIKEKVDGHVQRGETMLALQTLNMVRQIAVSVPDVPWKKRYMKHFDETYKHLLYVKYTTPKEEEEPEP